jgi:hypothetical protein
LEVEAMVADIFKPATKDLAGRLTHDEVVALVGDLDDGKVAEILAIGATACDLDEAIAWAESESDVMGELEKRLDEPATSIYRILMTRKALEPDRER